MNRFSVKFFVILTLLLFSMFLLSGCMYGKVRYPLDRDVDRTRLGTKVGTASAYSVAWLVSWGDAGTARAAQNGDIRIINHLDGEYFILLGGLYARHTTIAYGD
jgi:hypothetical protein